MSEYVLRVQKGGRDYYMLWSSVVDAPITPALPERTFLAYCDTRRDRLGVDVTADDVELAKRPCGTSDTYDPPMTVANVIAHNRAGAHERELTLRGIIRRYAKECPNG